MEILNTVNVDGSRNFEFGGAQAYKVKQVGDYVVSLEWFGPTTRSIDACVVIWPAAQGFDAGAWMISRKRITAYTDRNNRPTPYAFDEAFEALKLMGKMPLNMEVRRLVSLLMDQIDDLVQMPAASVAVKRRVAGEAMWEVTQKTLDGKVVSEAAV